MTQTALLSFLLLVATIQGSTPEGEAPMQFGLRSAEDDILAARLAIRTSIAISAPEVGDQLMVVGRSGPVSLAEAAEIVAGVPRPKRCKALLQSARLEIECSAISEYQEQQAQAALALMLTRPRSAIGLILDSLGASSGARVLVIFPSGSELTRCSGLLRWAMDYDFPAGMALGTRDPTDLERESGVQGVLVVDGIQGAAGRS